MSRRRGCGAGGKPVDSAAKPGDRLGKHEVVVKPPAVRIDRDLCSGFGDPISLLARR